MIRNRVCQRLRLRMAVLLLMAGAVVAGEGPQTRPESAEWSFTSAAGVHDVAELLAAWMDESRHRSIPVKVYYPQWASGPSPVIVFSHGLGGSRESYAYLGRFWASHGYVVVHLQHAGSDVDVWKGKEEAVADKALREAASAENAAARVADMAFAIEHLAIVDEAESALRGRLHLERVGVAGHSFGAHTTLQAAGAKSLAQSDRPGPSHPRIKAAVAMSPPPPRIFSDTYGLFAIPCLHMTGTRDDAPMIAIEAPDRRIPYEQIRGPRQYLIVFDGADHQVFSTREPRRGRESRDRRMQDHIRGCTLVFWDAYLRDDRRARRWLDQKMGPALQGQAEVCKKSERK